MQSDPPFAIWVPQDSPANSSIKRSFLGQMSPLVPQALAGWRRGGGPAVPTLPADAMWDDIARARIQKRAHRGQRAALEVPLSGGNRPRAPQKWRPKVTFSLRRMYPSSPRAKQTTLTSFLASKLTADNGKRSKTDAENEDQMSGKGSIESPGRIDTRGGHKHVLVMCDRFTKLTRAILLLDATALTVSSAFIDTWVAAYGIPDSVLTDNGPQFASVHYQGILGLLGIASNHTFPYHPQTNGQLERDNRTLVRQLRCYIAQNQKE